MLALITTALVVFTVYAIFKALFSWGQVANEVAHYRAEVAHRPVPTTVTNIQKNVYYNQPVQYNYGR